MKASAKDDRVGQSRFHGALRRGSMNGVGRALLSRGSVTLEATKRL
jgi:hypothetical protein